MKTATQAQSGQCTSFFFWSFRWGRCHAHRRAQPLCSIKTSPAETGKCKFAGRLRRAVLFACSSPLGILSWQRIVSFKPARRDAQLGGVRTAVRGGDLRLNDVHPAVRRP